jgi:hypothetical protein
MLTKFLICYKPNAHICHVTYVLRQLTLYSHYRILINRVLLCNYLRFICVYESSLAHFLTLIFARVTLAIIKMHIGLQQIRVVRLNSGLAYPACEFVKEKIIRMATAVDEGALYSLRLSIER